MKRLYIICFFSVFILYAMIPASAMMGGGMGNHMGGSDGWNGQGGSFSMHDNPNYNRPQPERTPRYESPNQGYLYNSEPMTPEKAEILVHRYMGEKTTRPYRIKDLHDKGSYYMADIEGTKAGDQERLLIDKETGKIHSLGR